MDKFDQLITSSKLQLLEQQEWYLRNNKINTDIRSYIFNRFKNTITMLFGDDEYARDIIEELR